MTIPKTILLFTSLTAIGCSAFAPPSLRCTPATLRTKPLISTNKESTSQLHATDSDDRPDNNDQQTPLSNSLPSPDTLKQNILDGKFGQRGEPYVIAQSILFLLIPPGYVPILQDAAAPLLGSLLLLSGGFLVYRSAVDLRNNLSPWPVPADPASGRGSLVDSGVYSRVRHPMYAGVLLGMAGWSVATDSAVRLLLTGLLYFVLDRKSEFEEEKLGEVYGEEYDRYREGVEDKFFPSDLRKVFM
ncbi:hypothetical protein ACHAW6_005266 [Cyclotella cf. meneghiniana]